MNTKLLRALCEIPGIPGREERVRAFIEKEVKGLFDEMWTDAMGSLICVRHPTAKGAARTKKPKRIMMAAHMDEIGFYVRHIDDKGFLWVNPAGGFDARNLFSRRVLVCCDGGDYPGLMNPGGRPVHIATPEDRKKVPELNEFFIDLGMTPDDAKKNVKIGDFVVMHEPFIEQPLTLASKALDNRVACYLAIESVRQLAGDKKSKPMPHSCEVVAVFTVQEEVGLRGAVTSAYAVNADCGIGLDVTLACDTPGVPDNQAVSRHGEGAAILVQDSSMIADYQLVNELCAIAKKHKIPYQRSILPAGGQDGAAIQRAHAGVRACALCVGTRYIHTVTESVHKKDLQAATDLLAHFLAQYAG